MSDDSSVERLLERYVEGRLVHGRRLTIEELCADRPELAPRLREIVARYERLDETLDGHAFSTPTGPAEGAERPNTGDLPRFGGFETVERIGGGGMGDVYKLRDLQLDRVVAAKVLRADTAAAARFGDFLGEARAMALFQDDRIVRIHEFRADAEPPVILMEHVDGFDLGRVAPSLEPRQRARILLEVCEAVHHAHQLGIQHRDLKPANILLTSRLQPKIVDFGLAGSDPRRGHLVGTPAYLAPEQLDPSRPIDARSDVYALGVILYELLCGTIPEDRLHPRLPVEIDPEAPEPLQAIALKALEHDAEARYPTAREMALDLRRWIEGRPVLARPSAYRTALGRRLGPHLQQIEEWLRLKLIYPHEASRLRGAYRRLESRDDDWIVQSRVLSYSQIALYLGAFLLVAGGLLYFGAHRFFEAVDGVVGPLGVLGLPFAGLSAAAFLLYRREHRAVGVAFWLAGVLLLPLLLLILLHEAGLWAAAAGAEHQFFGEGTVSNRQLQIALAASCGWAGWLALRTRTVGLSSVATLLLVLFGLAVLTDLGLDTWIEESAWDRLALHLTPLLLLLAGLGVGLERSGRAWFGRPLYVGAAVLWVLVLELLALNGRALDRLGVSMVAFQGADVPDPVLLDTLTAMTVNGGLIYLTGWLLERRGTDTMREAVWLLVVVSPFALLEPVAWLVGTTWYSPRWDWFYLLLALAIAVLSRYRQRKSFYLAGLSNTGLALWLITERREWFDRPAWAVVVILLGLLALVLGFGLDWRRRRLRRDAAGR
jgi:serine/threonine protein kinase